MARDIDRLIEYIKREADYLPPVSKQVIINRLEPQPSQEEIDIARKTLYNLSVPNTNGE